MKRSTGVFHACMLVILLIEILIGRADLARAADARVLPAGRSRFSVILGQSAAISETTTSEGEHVSIMSPYQLELSGQNFRRADPRVSELVLWLNNQSNYRYDISDTSNHGVVFSNNSSLPLLGDALSRGSLGLDAEVHRTQYVISYQYGVTSNWSAGFAIPLIKQSVRFQHAINGRNTARDIYQGFAAGNSGAAQQLVDGLSLLSQIDTETFQSILESRGYQRFSDFEGSGLGDGILGSRLLYLDRPTRFGPLMSAVQTQITIPSGRLASPDHLTELDFGSGGWTAQFVHIATLALSDRWSLSHQFGYTSKLPFSRLRRVPGQPGDFLPGPANEERVQIKLGDQIMTSAGASLRLNPTLLFETQIFWERKTRDSITGTRQSAASYSSLSEGTDSTSCYIQGALTASSISAFLRNRFAVPGDITLTWNQPVSGRNQILTPYGIAELALYF